MGLQGADLVRRGAPPRGFLAWWPRIELAAVLVLVWVGAAGAVPLLEPVWTTVAASDVATNWLWVLAAGAVAMSLDNARPLNPEP